MISRSRCYASRLALDSKERPEIDSMPTPTRFLSPSPPSQQQQQIPISLWPEAIAVADEVKDLPLHPNEEEEGEVEAKEEEVDEDLQTIEEEGEVGSGRI